MQHQLVLEEAQKVGLSMTTSTKSMLPFSSRRPPKPHWYSRLSLGKKRVVIAKVLKRRTLRIQAVKKLKSHKDEHDLGFVVDQLGNICPAQAVRNSNSVPTPSIVNSQSPASPKSTQTVGLLSLGCRSAMTGALGCHNVSLEEDTPTAAKRLRTGGVPSFPTQPRYPVPLLPPFRDLVPAAATWALWWMVLSLCRGSRDAMVCQYRGLQCQSWSPQQNREEG